MLLQSAEPVGGATRCGLSVSYLTVLSSAPLLSKMGGVDIDGLAVVGRMLNHLSSFIREGVVAEKCAFILSSVPSMRAAEVSMIGECFN